MAERSKHLVLSMPDRQSLTWIAILVRLAWLPILVSIATRWAMSAVEILGASVVAHAVLMLGGAQDEAIPIPGPLRSWLDASGNPLIAYLLTGLLLVLVAQGGETLVQWTRPWIHLVLNRVATPRILSVVTRRSGARLLDPSTAVQRWLLKLDISYFLQDSVAATIGDLGRVVIIVGATYWANTVAGHVSLACLVVWLSAAVPLLRGALRASRRSALAHEDTGRAIRDGISLQATLARPSLRSWWVDRHQPSMRELHESIKWQGIWNLGLVGILGGIVRAMPIVAMISAVVTGSPGVALVVLLYLNKIAGSLTGLVYLLPYIQQNLISVQRLYELGFAPDSLTTRPEAAFEIANGVEAPSWQVGRGGGPRIAYPDVALRPGHLVCVVGPSGSGKSTLLEAMAGQLQGSSAKLALNGVEFDPNDERWQQTCAYVPQEPELVPGTVSDNLDGFPNWTRTDAITRAVELIEARCPDGALADVGIDDKGVSVGQRRAIAVLRAIGSDAPVMLLDEPIAGVDDELAAALAAALREALRRGRTALLTAHKHDWERVDLKPAAVITLEPVSE